MNFMHDVALPVMLAVVRSGVGLCLGLSGIFIANGYAALKRRRCARCRAARAMPRMIVLARRRSNSNANSNLRG